MTNTFKRFVSIVLSFVMAMTCLVFVNVTGVSAHVPETLYKFYANSTDATNNGDSTANNAKNIFTGGITGSTAFTAGTYNVEGKDYELKYCSDAVYNVTIVVPEGVVDASFSIVLKSYSTSARTMTLKKNGVTVGSTKSVSTATVLNYTGLSTGTYTLSASSTVRYSLLTLNVPAICTISGTVTDGENNPIRFATVYLDGKNSFETRTEKDGDYSITLPCDNYTMKVTALEHTSDSRNVTANEDVTADFVLQKSGDKVQTYKYYGNATSASSNYDSLSDNATSIFPNMTTSATTSGAYTITSGKINMGGSTYKLPYTTSAKSSITIVVPQAVEHANFYGAFKSNGSLAKFTLSKNGKVVDSSKSLPASATECIEYTDLSDGTYTLTTSNGVYPALLMLTTSPYHIASGTVTDIEGNPIKCATVDTSWGIEVVTDKEGKYSVRVPEGKNTFTVTALDYVGASKSFTAKNDITVNFKIEKYGNKVKTYKYYGNATSASSNYDSLSDNATTVFPSMTTNATTSGAYVITTGKINMGGSTYNLPYTTSARTSITIAVPEAVEHANFYGAFKSNGNASKFTLSKDGKVVDSSKTLPASPAGCIEYMDLSGGTYTLTTTQSVYPALLMLTTSAEHTVSGVVTNTEDEPIKCAKIVTSWGTETKTDNEGKYTVGVPEGTNTINVTALGYASGSETFTLDEDIELDFTLSKDRNTVYKFYGNATDAATNYDSINDNATNIFTNAVTGTAALTTALRGEYIVEGSAYELSYRGAGRSSYTIVVPEGVDDAELYIVALTNNSGTVALNKNSTVVGSYYTNSATTVNYKYTGLNEGTYTLTFTSTLYPVLFMLATSPVYTISGTVTNTAGEPMRSAHVYIGDKKLTTDKDGKYSVDVGVDNTITNIKVTALGYKDKDEKVSINGETIQDIVIHKNRNTIHKFYGNATDASANYDNINNNATDIFTNAVTNTAGLPTTLRGTYDIEGSAYKLSNRGAGRTSFTVEVPEGVDDGELYVTWYTSASNTVNFNKGDTVLDTQKMNDTSVKTFVYRDLTEGTYTFTSTSTMYPVLLILATSPVYTLSGTVTNAKGNPIKCGNVYVGDDVRVRTDGTGGYATDIAEGVTINNIKVTAFGYEDKDESVAISDETTNDIVVDNGAKDIVYKFFSNQGDATRNYDSTSNNDVNVFTNALLGSTSITRYGGGDFDIEGSTFKLYYVSNNSRNLNIVVPEGITDADLYMIGKASSTPVKLTLSKDGDVIDDTKSMVSTTTSTVKYEGLSEGTYTLKGNYSFKYSLLAIAATQDELPIITEENVTSGVKVVSNGMASEIGTNSPFADAVTELNATDKLFTLVGMVTGKHKDSSFMNKINQVGFVLYDADVVDSLGEDAKTMNPRELKSAYSDADFAGVTIRTGTVYKNFYDESQYDESLDSADEYIGEASLEANENKSYFAYVVALSEDRRYYAYPFTLYSGTNLNSYDETINNLIEIAYDGVTTSYINDIINDSVEINTEEDNTESESVENVTEDTSTESDTTEVTSVASEEAE